MSATRRVDESGGGRRTCTSATAFAMLGPLEVTGPDGPITITGPKERAVLSVLIAWAGEVVSIDRLTDALWGERPPRSSVRVIHNLVSRLRKVLGPEAIETLPGGYVLRAPPDAVDARRFERLMHEGRQHAAGGRWRAGAIALSAAAELWRGPPLNDLGDWPPACAEAARLEEQQRCLVEEAAEAELACGRHHELVAPLEALVEAEPLRERRWALLMLALHRGGRQADALRAFQRARTALAELGLEPSPALTAVEHDVSLQIDRSRPGRWDETRSGADRPGNLPRPATELVGRVSEVQERTAELALRRLVTLTGAGGVGKTRLAIEIAWSLVDDFSGGTWMVELALVADPAAVVASVASTLSVQPRPGLTMEEAVVEWARGRQLLLLLDNCEHVLAPVTPLVEALVAECPTVTILVTSREPLGIPGEWVHSVAPLDPATEGVELFCDRAVAVDDAFTPNDEDRVAIASICRRLDGLPLAIELAAARMRSSTAADLLRRLDDRFRLLRKHNRGGPPRHQTLRATVDWSYDLLDDDERLLFDRLSVFAGRFDLAAVEAVAAAGLGQSDIAMVLDSLVARSMVTAHRSNRGVRYGLLETLRQYGRERLGQHEDIAVIRERHLAHYLGVAARARALWAGPRQVEAHEIFDHEWDNLRGALSWSAATANSAGADALVAATGPHAWCRLNHEHGHWASRALALAAVDQPPNPATYGWAAYWMLIASDYDRAIALAGQGIDAASGPEHPDTTWCWGVLAWSHLFAGRAGLGAPPARHAQVAADGHDDLFAQSWARIAAIEEAFIAELPTVATRVAQYAAWADRIGAPSLLSRAAFYQGQMALSSAPTCAPDALAFYERGLDLAHQAGDINNEGKNLLGAITATAVFQTDDAFEVEHEALLRLYDTRHWSLIWIAVEAVAGWLFIAHGIVTAAVIFGHLDAHHPVMGGKGPEQRRRDALRWAQRQPQGDQLLARGAAMTGDEVVTLVLDELGTRRGSRGVPSPALS